MKTLLISAALLLSVGAAATMPCSHTSTDQREAAVDISKEKLDGCVVPGTEAGKVEVRRENARRIHSHEARDVPRHRN